MFICYSNHHLQFFAQYFPVFSMTSTFRHHNFDMTEYLSAFELWLSFTMSEPNAKNSVDDRRNSSKSQVVYVDGLLLNWDINSGLWWVGVSQWLNKECSFRLTAQNKVKSVRNQMKQKTNQYQRKKANVRFWLNVLYALSLRMAKFRIVNNSKHTFTISLYVWRDLIKQID